MTRPKTLLRGRKGGVAVIALPLSPDRFAELNAPIPLTDGEWALMLAVLAAMRPGLSELAPLTDRPTHAPDPSKFD